MTPTPDANNLFAPGQPLPPDNVMVKKALEILEHSPHGQQLVNFAEKKEIQIKIAATQAPSTYLPQKNLAYVCFNRNLGPSPARFVLMLVMVLREAQQEAAGLKLAPLTATLEQYTKAAMDKREDVLWYLCTVANELNSLDYFTEYKFLDEVRNMGHNEVLELVLKQKRNP